MMSADLEGFGRAVASILATPRDVTVAASVAVLSVAQHLLAFVATGVAIDIGRLKEAMLRKAEARADAASADAVLKKAAAMKTLAEAALIANSASERSARPPSGANEESTRDALASLEAAVSRLQQHGGAMMVDSAALARLVRESVHGAASQR